MQRSNFLVLRQRISTSHFVTLAVPIVVLPSLPIDGFGRPLCRGIGRELTTLGSPHPVKTIFIGGGTPTLLPRGQMVRLFEEVRHGFRSLTTENGVLRRIPKTLLRISAFCCVIKALIALV